MAFSIQQPQMPKPMAGPAAGNPKQKIAIVLAERAKAKAQVAGGFQNLTNVLNKKRKAGF